MLKLPAYLTANPHYYDYVQSIELKIDGTMELLYGEGQGVRFFAKGKYVMKSGMQPGQFQITFSKMSEYDPYAEAPLESLPDFTVSVKREIGLFTFIQEIPGKIINLDEVRCLLYRVRYLFDIDPFHSDLQQGDELWTYYALTDYQSATYGALKAQNIEITENPQDCPE